MKKLILSLFLALLIPLFTACEVSNTDLANSLEGNMTRLVYSIGYLDSISVEDLTGLVNNSSYFTHSSLYSGESQVSSTKENATANNVNLDTSNTSPIDTGENALNGGLDCTTNNPLGGRTIFQNSNYRLNSYSSGITNNSNSLLSPTNNAVGTYSAGTVDMSLLESNAEDLNNILLEISTKRGIIMLYCTDLRSGRATLSAPDKDAIKEYDDILEETTNYLNNTSGTLITYFNGISSISSQENSAELINAKLIRANEVLKTRYAKLDTCLDAMNAILNILINSIGYDYATLYTQGLTPPVTDPSTLNDETSTTNPTSTITNDTTTHEDNFITDTPSTYPMINPLQTQTNTQNNNCCDNQSTNSNCCNNNLSTNNTTVNDSSPSVAPQSTTTPQNTSSSGDTIVNYNYDGNNTSTINNNQPKVNTPTTLELTDKDYNELNKANKTENVLNGGLNKKTSSPNIVNEKNADNIVASAVIFTAPSIDGEINEIDALTLAPPVEPKNHKIKSPTENKPTLLPSDFSEPEIGESERELTPELLPFTSTTPTQNPKTLEIKSLSSPELGSISFLPFVYEEDNCLKKIPR